MVNQIIELSAVLTTVIVVGLSLAHALELPGKLCLNREQYLTVQPIYYPGFTLAGVSEPISIALLAALLFLTPAGTTKFWLVTGAFLAAVWVQIIFWTLTQSVNRFWLERSQTGVAAQRFLGTTVTATGSPHRAGSADWTELRNRWELSHLLRAVVGMMALILLVVAVVI